MPNRPTFSACEYSSHRRSPSASSSYHFTAAPGYIGSSNGDENVVTRDQDTVASADESTKSISGVALRLLNVGSVARDHLASERTYLAYVRTSLALSSVGVGA